MKIAVAQLSPVVGSFEQNVRQIKEAYQRACSQRARLLLTSELGLCGYPPHDLVERPEMFDRNEKALEELAAATRGQATALAVGHIAKNPSETGRAAQNVVTILEDGKQVFRQAKTLLPTYDVFDEARYFEPAERIQPWICDGKRIAVAICEDLWAHDPTLGRKLYGKDPIEQYRAEKVEFVLSLSASPYEWGKTERRVELHAEVARKLKAPLIYVNQVGATDEILFDGGSFALDSQGALTGRLPLFKSAYGLIELADRPVWEAPEAESREDQAPEEVEILLRGLITGIREYFTRTGFKTAVIGLSGGIDSAVVAALAAQAISAKNVLGVAMPSQYSSSHSMEDAELLARNLGMPFEVRPIKFLFSTSNRELGEARGQLSAIAQENLQSRLRGLIIMTLANHYSALALTTGNKSEIATGYCTLYGDMVGAIAPIGDVFKTRVYELARHINRTLGNPIPERSITKAPSAELKPGQTDQDTLPPYDILDELLADYLEKRRSVAAIQKRFGAAEYSKRVSRPDWIKDTLRRIEVNEYKRRQGAPVLKISSKAFGIGRRIPIAKLWDQ